MSGIRRTSSSATPLVVSGAVVGLAWAGALRGWMTQMAGDESEVHWLYTFGLVLVPGLAVGALVGLAEHRRRIGGSRRWWLTLAPCLFLSALLDPAIFKGLITNGTGGGAIGVVTFGLAGGYALSGRGRAWSRRTCGGVAVFGVLIMFVMASDNAPLETARGVWVGVLASSLIALLVLACAIPQRIGRSSLVPSRWIAVAIGALCGLAWAAALRSFMRIVAGADSQVDWVGTFVWVLLPGSVIGGLLGWAEARRWIGPVPHRRLLAWSPMLFGSILLSNPMDLLGGFDGGIGLAAVAVPAMCMLGGYAIAGRGPAWVRVPCGVVALSAIPIWSLTATDVGGSSLSLRNAHGAWAAVFYWSLMATFSLAAAIPHRRPVALDPQQSVSRSLSSPATR